MITSALAASELRYRRLFEAARDGILILDPDTRQIIDVNPYLMEFLGYDYGEFIGKELFELGLLRDKAACQSAFCELRSAGYIRYEDLPLRTKAGKLVAVEFVSNLYEEGDRQVIQCNIRDGSARKLLEEARISAEDARLRRNAELESLVNVRTAELRFSNAQLEAFVYSIAHDLRAPLRAMQAFSELLVQEHAAQLSDQGQRYANFINQAALQMDRLLTDLLAFSQISQQRIELAPVSLETVVQGALASCEAEIQASRARISVLPPWPLVLAHAGTLRQALVNLIGNAVKFVAADSPRLRLWAEVRPNQIVRIWVEDNGIGIPAEFHERIFQVFQRLHTTAYVGTGIGLAIVQKGVERMNGRVGLESAPGCGSKFWIELAQAPEAAAGNLPPNAPP